MNPEATVAMHRPHTAPPDEATAMYGKGFDKGPPQVGAGSLGFSWFSRFLMVVFLGLAAGFRTLPALALRPCGGGSVGRDLSASWSLGSSSRQDQHGGDQP
jgi:hypothetical protein